MKKGGFKRLALFLAAIQILAVPFSYISDSVAEQMPQDQVQQFSEPSVISQPDIPGPAPEKVPEVVVTEAPTPGPTKGPTPEPTEEPTPEPTEEPTPEPTEEPTPEPTGEPTSEPTEEPTPEPTAETTLVPEVTPVPEVTSEPETTAEPEITMEPEVTAEPETTPVPEITPEPEIPMVPDEAEDPDVNPEPVITPAPQVQERNDYVSDPDYLSPYVNDYYLDAEHLDIPEGGMPIPRIFQFDYRRQVCRIDGRRRSVSTSGCGATAVSMVIAYLRQNYEQTPYTLFYQAAEDGDYYGSGLTYEVLQKMLRRYNIESRLWKVTQENIKTALNEGKPVIINMQHGTFTNGTGHYVLLRGFNEDGEVLVNDPNSRRRSTEGSYSLQHIVSQSKTGYMLVAIPPQVDAGVESDDPDAVLAASIGFDEGLNLIAEEADASYEPDDPMTAGKPGKEPDPFASGSSDLPVQKKPDTKPVPTRQPTMESSKPGSAKPAPRPEPVPEPVPDPDPVPAPAPENNAISIPKGSLLPSGFARDEANRPQPTRSAEPQPTAVPQEEDKGDLLPNGVRIGTVSVVKPPRANLRMWPSPQGDVLCSVYSGTELVIKGLTDVQPDGYAWYQVAFDGWIVYIRSDLLIVEN